MTSSPEEVTQLLLDWSNGNQAALDKLMPLVYEELRRLAHLYMARERPEHTLQTSALVNEAYLRLVDQNVHWESRTQFVAIAAKLMRQILVDHARQRHRAKRGAGVRPVPLEEANIVSEERAAEMIALDDALENLASVDQRKCQILELRFFGGLSIEETAEVLQVSSGTVMRDWTLAKAWLRIEMTGDKEKIR
ncbi:MAG: sigma-70 family RNA polymerase sigma factor [Acidobacteriota bacterium]|nr:sigma-70 family RNA polymerase sigma factor [Acidobacteriota bacterium]